MLDHLDAISVAPPLRLFSMASPVIAAICHPISVAGSASAPITDPTPRRAGRPQQRSSGLQLLIYREILAAEVKHARLRLNCKAASAFEADLLAVNRQLLTP